MKYQKTFLSTISNIIFLISIIFLLSFVWINFYIRNLYKSLFSAIIITLFFCIIFFPIKIFSSKKETQKNINKNKLEYLKTQILLGNDIKTISILCKAYNLNNLSTTDNYNHLIDYKNNTDLFFVFDTEILKDSDVINILKHKQYNNIKIFCIEPIKFPTQQNCNISIENLNKIQEKLKQNNITIDYSIDILKKPKYSLKDVFCTVLNKQRSKGYLGFGFLLILSSLFSPYSVYYTIIGTALLLLSIYSRYNRRFNQYY